MFSTFLVVLPVFALIFAGWAVRRIGVLGPHATTELNRFVVYLALPALLFDVLAHTNGADLWQPGFIAAFGLSSLLVFALIIGLHWRRRHHTRGFQLADAAIDGLNGAYGNTGYVGFPLATAALGQAALLPTTIATIITVCVIFALAITLIETSLQAQHGGIKVAAKVARSLALNPLVVAPILGALVPAFGLSVPAPLETILKMLGGAASPCALVALGLFLAQSRALSLRSLIAASPLIGLKLIVQPALAWLLAALVFRLPDFSVHVAVLIAALPTGTGPFMLAEFYRREAETTSTVILVSTILAILTVSAYLATIQP